MADYLFIKGTTYYAQISIPKDLRSRIGPAPIKKSCQTSNKGIAKRIVQRAIIKIQTFFDKAQKMNSLESYPLRYLIQKELESAITMFHMYEARKIFCNLTVDEVARTRASFQDKLKEVTEDLKMGNLKNAENQIQTLADAAEGEVIRGGPIEDKNHLFQFMIDQQAILKGILKKIDGDYSGNDPAQIPAQIKQELQQESNSYRIRDLANEYLKIKNFSNTRTLSQYRNYFDVLLGCWGEETKLADINAKLVNQFMDALPHYPRNKNKRKELKGKKFQELIEMDLASNKCISKKTQKDYINAIKTFWFLAVSSG